MSLLNKNLRWFLAGMILANIAGQMLYRIIRVRLGIGEDETPDDKAGFVLSELPLARAQELNEMIRRAADAVRITVSEGVEKAMSACNA